MYGICHLSWIASTVLAMLLVSFLISSLGPSFSGREDKHWETTFSATLLTFSKAFRSVFHSCVMTWKTNRNFWNVAKNWQKNLLLKAKSGSSLSAENQLMLWVIMSYLSCFFKIFTRWFEEKFKAQSAECKNSLASKREKRFQKKKQFINVAGDHRPENSST